ncbi:MAG: SDR family NAD(P)-dependent oxidoreductase [Flavobacteriaceae bacterium]|jgi:3-hydroxy acid dehydrogenase/malonic semialdehyde reductase|nr:SDR family NAD(P)-dependent oxidoreductase [Flavobacteriaceae bacterium]NVJ73165.1 SDR family NAD(P)-dependent oxidoreductase [Flavobacteriaceae bacterium]
MNRKIALVTGASSGIGRATALRLAEEGFNLVICGRRKEQLDQLQKELPSDCQSHQLLFDVRDQAEVFKAIESLPHNFKSVDLLINNAGNAHGLDPFQEAPLDDFNAMIDINIKGLLYVSKAVLPTMLDRNNGHIINIGSTAAKEVYPNGSVYCASKAGVDAITKGMQLDLNKTDIKVGAIHPGLVQTNFSEVRFKGDQQRADQVYKGFKALQAEDIADIIAFVVTRPFHVNIADLVVMPTAQANSVTVNKKL